MISFIDFPLPQQSAFRVHQSLFRELVYRCSKCKAELIVPLVHLDGRRDECVDFVKVHKDCEVES